MEGRALLIEEITEKLFAFNINIEKNGFKTEVSDILSHYDIKFKKEEQGINNSDSFLDNYLSARKLDGLSGKTITNYRQRLTLFNKYQNKDLLSINRIDIQNYLRYITETRKLARTTIATEINILRGLFKWLYDEEYIKRTPMDKIKTIHIDKKRLRDPLNKEELERFRNACETLREKAIFEFYYSTGCRLAEAVPIKIDEINFNERSVRVLGKGNKERIVYFSVRAKILIEEYLKTRLGKCEYLFSQSKKSRISKGEYDGLGGRSIQEIISKIGKRANIKKNVFPHRLRHTFATDNYNSGMSITTIQRLMGHENLDTTQIYAKGDNLTVQYEYNKVM